MRGHSICVFPVNIDILALNAVVECPDPSGTVDPNGHSPRLSRVLASVSTLS